MAYEFVLDDEVASKDDEQAVVIPLDSDTPQWVKDALELHQNSDTEFAFTFEKESKTSEGFNLRVGSATLTKLHTDTIPKKKAEKIQRALDWAEEDDLINRLIAVKADFGITGFNLVCKPEEGTEVERLISSGKAKSEEDGNEEELTDKEAKLLIEHGKFRGHLNRINRKWDIRAIVRKLMEDYFITDSCILYWKFEKPREANESSVPVTESPKHQLIPGLADIAPLSPGDVDWDNSFGRDHLRVKIPVEIRDRISKALMIRTRPEREKAKESLMEEGIPQKYIDAVASGQDYVDLSRDDGDRWLIKTRARPHHGLAVPSMVSIFISLAIRRALKEGDFAAAFMMKHFILHVKGGEPITQGPLAGQRLNYLKKAESDKLFEIISSTNKASRLVTNHTVSFTFVFPPKEMFDGAKYDKHEEGIHNWAGVSTVIFSGEGGTYGSGFLSIKRLVAHLSDIRNEVNWLLTEFFDDPEINEAVGVPEECEVSASFDENALKEPKQLLDEIKLMLEKGLHDPQIAIRELGRQPTAIKNSKLQSIEENKRTKIWEPLFNPFEQLNDEGAGAGRPPNDTTTQNEDTRTQPPSGTE